MLPISLHHSGWNEPLGEVSWPTARVRECSLMLALMSPVPVSYFTKVYSQNIIRTYSSVGRASDYDAQLDYIAPSGFLLPQLLSESYSTILRNSNNSTTTKHNHMLFIWSRQQLALSYMLPLRVNNILINGNSSSIVAWTNHFEASPSLHALFFAPLTGYLRNNAARTNSPSHLRLIPRLLWLEGIGQWTGWPTFLWVGEKFTRGDEPCAHSG